MSQAATTWQRFSADCVLFLQKDKVLRKTMRLGTNQHTHLKTEKVKSSKLSELQRSVV